MRSHFHVNIHLDSTNNGECQVLGYGCKLSPILATALVTGFSEPVHGLCDGMLNISWELIRGTQFCVSKCTPTVAYGALQSMKL